MPKVHFTKQFDYTLEQRPGRPTMVYKRGTYSVPTAIAEAAIAAGKAEYAVDKPAPKARAPKKAGAKKSAKSR